MLDADPSGASNASRCGALKADTGAGTYGEKMTTLR